MLFLFVALFSLLSAIPIAPLMLTGHLRDIRMGTIYNIHMVMTENGAGTYSQFQDASQGKCQGCFGYGTMIPINILNPNTPSQYMEMEVAMDPFQVHQSNLSVLSLKDALRFVESSPILYWNMHKKSEFTTNRRAFLI
jgi:hypothetical protein